MEQFSHTQWDQNHGHGVASDGFFRLPKCLNKEMNWPAAFLVAGLFFL
jgi:hypothetical protein